MMSLTMASNRTYDSQLLRFLFKNEVQISMEFESFLSQDERCQLNLSAAAITSLKEKLLSHPREAACLFHQVMERSRYGAAKVQQQQQVEYDKGSEQEKKRGTIASHKAPQTALDINKLGKLFVECLDHCLRRIENLEEKLHKEEEEYSALIRRQQKGYSPMRSSIGKAKQQTFDTAEASSLKERMLVTNVKKQKNENVFYKLFSLSSSVELDDLCELFPRILKLCYEKKLLIIDKVHHSILASSRRCLQAFCEKEAVYLLESFVKNLEMSQGLFPFSFLDSREVFHYCFQRKKHILEIMYEALLSNPSWSMMELERHNEFHWLLPFWPLLCMHRLTRHPDEPVSTNVDEMWRNHSSYLDQSLIEICKTLNRDTRLISWCLARGSRVMSAPLLQVARDHTPLYVIHSSLSLHSLVPSEVFQILQEHCMARDATGSLFTDSKNTYTAFHILYQVFEVIGAGMQLDNIAYGWQARNKSQWNRISSSVGANSFQDRQVYMMFYKQNIAEKLKGIQNLLDTLQPLDYRLEVMENIYSLLFVRHSDTSDEEHSESEAEEGDMEQSCISQTTDGDSLVSTQVSVVPLRPSSPRKLNQTPSHGVVQQMGTTGKGLKCNFSEYVVLDKSGCEENFSNKASPASSISTADNEVKHVTATKDYDIYMDSSDSSAMKRKKFNMPLAPVHPQWDSQQQMSQDGGWTGNQQSSCNISGKSTASSVSELPRTGYLINTLVAWDVMLLLRDSLLVFSAESFKWSVGEGAATKQALQRRVSHLSCCISEGLWRLQVMVPCTHLFATPDVFDEFLDGSLLSHAPHSLIYEALSEEGDDADLASVKPGVSGAVGGKRRGSWKQEPHQVQESSFEQKSVINYLLAPSSSLITLSLANGNVDKIEQIFHTYKISDTMEKREAQLAVRLSQLRPKLLIGKQQKIGKLKESRISSSSQDSLHNLGLLAREGTAQVGATNLIHDLVTSSPPPVPKGIPEAILDTGCPVMASFLTPQALVLADLALTTNVTETTATYLIDQALQRQNAQNSKHEKHSEMCICIPGYIPLLQQFATLCNAIISIRQSGGADVLENSDNSNLYIDLSDQTATPFSLLLSTLPLKETEMRKYISSWSRVYKSIFAVQEGLSQSDVQEEKRVSLPNLQETHIHVCYKSLLRTLSEETQHLYPRNTKGGSKTKLGAYVRSFYQYLQLLASMVTQHADVRFLSKRNSYFTLLAQRPVDILGTLMFEESVDPSKLEPIAARMRLNLTSMILQYCCPKFKVAKDEINKISMADRKMKIDSLGFQVMQEKVILNAGTMTCHEGAYGEVVVRDVLTTLLSGLRDTIQPTKLASVKDLKVVILNDATAVNALSSEDIRTALRDTSELAAVDFRKMAPGSEAVVFFINLANLMYIHAGMLNHILYPSTKRTDGARGIFSQYQLERIFAMRRVGYVVGQIGFLSLYDILYTLLPLQNPLSSILIQTDSKHKISLCESDLLSHKSVFLKREEFEIVHNLFASAPAKVKFCLTRGTPVSPSIQVFYADRLEEQMEEAVLEHIRLFLLVQESKKVGKSTNVKEKITSTTQSAKFSISSTRTVLDYLALHSDGFIGGIQSLEHNMPDDVTDTLRKLKYELSNRKNVDIKVLDRCEVQGVALEFIESFEGQDKSTKSENVAEDETEGGNKPSSEHRQTFPFTKVPVAVLGYLRRQCPLLAFIVQVYHHTSTKTGSMTIEEETEDYMDAWLNLLYPPGLGVKPPAEDTNSFAALRTLASLPRHRVLASIHGSNKVASALSSTPDACPVWDLADMLLGSRAVTRNHTTQLAAHAASMVAVVQALPSLITQTHPDLLLFLDHLLAFLVYTSSTTAEPPPWTYAHQIIESNLRYAVVLETHRAWPVTPAVELLTLVAHDPNLTTNKQDWATRRADIIKLYDKIALVGREICGHWQDVEVLSSERPAELLHHLIHKKQFRLSVQWSEYHQSDDELRQLIDQSYLMDVLDKTTPDFTAARKVINILSYQDFAFILKELLQKLPSIPTRRFLIEEFLKRKFTETPQLGMEVNTELDNQNSTKEQIATGSIKAKGWSGLPPVDVRNLLQEVMGLILLEDVAPGVTDRFQLSHLVSAPHLIIEQWLMNVRLEAIEKALKVLAPYLDMVDTKMQLKSSNTDACEVECCGLSRHVLNQLFETYAAKSLDTTGVQLTLKSQPANDKLPRKFVMPSEPPRQEDWIPDAEVRKCPVCEVAIFSMFCRRHHCRRCGRVVCGSCSRHRGPVQGYGDLMVRVCLDCYKQTKEINLNTYIQVRPLRDGLYDTVSVGSGEDPSYNGGASWASEGEGGWYLTTDAHHNDIIRHEFSFDYAPSLSLCLAILALHCNHREAAICTVRLSHRLFILLISSMKSKTATVDHTFILSMIQTLLTSAKVRFGNVGEQQGIGLSEYYTQWVDLLSVLIKSNCNQLISEDSLENMLLIGDLRMKSLIYEEDVGSVLEKQLRQEFNHMRWLRDSLVKKYMWELALDVSTKAGLETNGVWGAWAMASLKAGDYPGARERFSRVLERPVDKNRPCKSSLLPEVIKYLETNPFHVDQEVMDRAQRTRASVMMADHTQVSPSQTLVVLHTLNNLHRIADGSLTIREPYQRQLSGQRSRRTNSFRLEPIFHIECKYYLSLYGSHAMTLQYFMRNRQMQELVEYLLSENVKGEIFIKDVLVPCLRRGQHGNLITSLSASDPHMNRWGKLIFGGCRWLERQGWWNCLLSLQEALGDKLRAAMTLLRMYTDNPTNFATLASRSDLVTSALSHLQAHLDDQALSPVTVKRKAYNLNMSPWQVNQTINMLTLQIDVTKFISSCESKGDDIRVLLQTINKLGVMKHQHLPTLLSGNDEKLAIVILLICGTPIVANGLNLAYRIVERTRLPVDKLVSLCCQVMWERGSLEQVEAVVRGLQEWEMVTSDVCDVALRPTLIAAASTNSSHLSALVKLLSSDKAKMEVYIECGRLRSAYLVAVHQGSRSDVERVKAAADASSQAHIAAMCNKWLRNFHGESGVMVRMRE